MTLRVVGYTGSSTLTNFQALVKLSDNDDYGFSYADCAAADGSDLWFEDAEGNLTGGRSNSLEYKPAPYSNDDGGQRPKIEPWSGKYVTAAFDGSRQYLVEGTSLGEGKPRSNTYDKAAKRFAWGGNPSGSTRYVKGTYHSVRIYNATLTDDELYWNRIVDEARFRGGFAGIKLLTALRALVASCTHGRLFGFF